MPLTMTLDDKEFTLSDECLVAMATTLWHTKVKERGFMLCQDEEITPGPEHIGGRGSIHVRNCKGKPLIGWFHTHPGTSSRLSWGDGLSLLAASASRREEQLYCVGGKTDELIRCQTLKMRPTVIDYALMKGHYKERGHLEAEGEPEMRAWLTESYTFEVRKVPEIIKPPVPVPVAPRIKTEELVFAESRFMKYTNLDTGETRIERVY